MKEELHSRMKTSGSAKASDLRAMSRTAQPGAFGSAVDVDAGRGEPVGRTAELAGHADHAVLDHVVAVVLREALEHGGDAVARARALGAHRRIAKHPHAALMKQTIDQPLARHRRVDQLDVL